MSYVFPVIQGNAQIPCAKDLEFGNLDSLTAGNVVDAKPDCYDGHGLRRWIAESAKNWDHISRRSLNEVFSVTQFLR